MSRISRTHRGLHDAITEESSKQLLNLTAPAVQRLNTVASDRLRIMHFGVRRTPTEWRELCREAWRIRWLQSPEQHSDGLSQDWITPTRKASHLS